MSNKIEKIKSLFVSSIFNYNFLIKNKKIVYIQKYISLEAILKKYKDNVIFPFTFFLSWFYHNNLLYKWLYTFIEDNIDSKSHVILKDYMTINEEYSVKNFLFNSFKWSDYDYLLLHNIWENIDIKWKKFLKDNFIFF